MDDAIARPYRHMLRLKALACGGEEKNQRGDNADSCRAVLGVVEADQFPALIFLLMGDLCDAAKVHLKIPTLINRLVRDVTHQGADQPFMTNKYDILAFMCATFFFQQVCDPASGFFASFALGKSEVFLSFEESLPFVGIGLLYFLNGQSLKKAVVQFVETFIDNGREPQLSGDIFDGLGGSQVGADVDR